MKGDIIDPVSAYVMFFGALVLLAVALVINYGFNALILFLAFRYLKAKVTTEKLLKGCMAATAAGIIADLLANIVALSAETTVPLKFLLYGAIAFAGIFAANYLLAEKYYRIKKGKAEKVGIAMGILTNPVWLMIILMLLGT